MADKMKTAPLDAQVADQLLDLLSTDDLFRERFQRDPLAALRSIGYESPGAGQMTACGQVASQPEPFAECKVNVLASKSEIAAAREEIRLMLVRGLNYTTPKLDAGVSSDRRLRK